MTASPWRLTTIGQLGEIVAGRQRSDKITAGTPRPYLRVANVQDGWLDLDNVLTMPFTDQEADRFRLQPGDVLVNEGQSRELAGRSAIYEGSPADCCFQNTVLRFRSGEGISPAYAHLLFQQLRLTGVFAAIALQTTSIAHLGARRFCRVSVRIPPRGEQDRITRVIEAWSQAEEKARQLTKAARLRATHLAAEVLTARRRLPGFSVPWGSHWLGDLFSERDETNRVDLPLLAITADRGVIPREEVERKDTSPEDKRLYKRIAAGDIGYNTMRMWQGVSALSPLEGIVSPAYTVCVPRSEIDGEFASYLFKLPSVVNLFRRHSQGLVDDTLSLKYHHFARISVTIPDLPEQRAIVGILKTADREIELLEKLLDAYRRQKRGLMQKLLTGQIRVKV